MDRDAFGLAQSNQFLWPLLWGGPGLPTALRAMPEALLQAGNLNNHCYLSLLLGEDPALEREAERIVLAFPAGRPFCPQPGRV